MNPCSSSMRTNAMKTSGDRDDAEVVRPEQGREQEGERPSTSRGGPSS